MKVKLISPKMSLRPMDSEYKRALSPSLSLLTIASLTPPEHSVYIEDENTQKIDFDDRPDLVGITVNVDTAKRAYAIASRYRQRNIPVIFGGIHASSDPDEALKHGDSVCIGEAEEIWGRILEDALNNRLKNKYYNNCPTDLEKVPLPRRDLTDTSKYLYTNIVCSSRGCPFKCEFCYNSNDYVHKQHRTRPIANVIEEISRLGTKQVMFIDDNFIGNPRWTFEFLKRIKPLDLIWHAAGSLNIVHDLKLLDAMAESGCKSLFIGFESINADSLNSVNKSQNNIRLYEKLIREVHSRNIMLNASLVFGFDHDRPSVFRETLDWLVENRIETMTAHILTPYPGTVLYKKLLHEGRITDFNTDHYNTAHVVFKPQNMTEEELFTGYLWIYDRFYSLKNIYKRLPENSEQKLSYLLFNLGYRKFGRLTSLLGKFGLMNFIGKIASRLAYNISGPLPAGDRQPAPRASLIKPNMPLKTALTPE